MAAIDREEQPEPASPRTPSSFLDEDQFDWSLPVLDWDWEYKEEEEPTSYVTDDNYGFLATGRDYEPADVSHRYTEEEKKTLATYESQDYLPSHSLVFKNWLQTQTETRFQIAYWFMMGLIGFSVGLMGFFMHQFITLIASIKWKHVTIFFDEGSFALAWTWAVIYTSVFVFISSATVVFLRPSAGGSGLPELTSYLNGTLIRQVFNVKTMVVKFVSCVCAVGCGMPVGPEGPMIHLGALVGAGLSQMRSETLKIDLPFLHRFRNSEDRRNFISAGAAAGVASAFGAPVGGLLFSMEEVSSFWTTTLTWQIFFCCMVSTFTTDLFNSALEGFKPSGTFGQFRKERYILFNIDSGIDINIQMFIPTIIIGAIGGVLGALFTFLNLKMARIRKKAFAKLKRMCLQKLARCLEPILLMVVVTSVYIFLPAGFGCTDFTCSPGEIGNISHGCYNDSSTNLHVEPTVVRYLCPKGSFQKIGSTLFTNGSYNEVASLFFLTGEDAVKHLFSRGTHLQFGYVSLLTVLILYFLFVCWASGTAVSSGILVPMLFIGGLYGRLVGLSMVNILTTVNSRDPSYWSWMDPGAFALIGAASFFGGVTRLTVAVTVIMMELTNDVQFLLPTMVSIMVSKWIGDFFTHPIYHSILELKCIPFLRPEPRLVIGSQRLNAEMYAVRDVMNYPVVTVYPKQSVYELAEMLLKSTHSGFPVVRKRSKVSKEKHFYGLITRLELCVLLMKEELFYKNEDIQSEIVEENRGISLVNYTELTVEKLTNPDMTMKRLQKYIDEPKYRTLFIDLYPFINESAMSISEKFSLYRTYLIFRTLGLRHLVVVDEFNRVQGIITRKDLMDFKLLERVSKVVAQKTKLGKVIAKRNANDMWDVTAMWDSSIMDTEVAELKNQTD